MALPHLIGKPFELEWWGSAMRCPLAAGQDFFSNV